MKKADQRLLVRVIDGKLRIDIGVNTLAWSAVHLPDHYGKNGEEPSERYRVVDPVQFAREVQMAILDEAEDGSNLIHVMLDKAITNALDDGAIHFFDLHEVRDEYEQALRAKKRKRATGGKRR